MMNQPGNSLQLGIAAYKAGDKAQARTHLLKAVREDPNDERAWGWLSNTTTNADERIHCLRQVVRINPSNASAAKLLKELESHEWLSAGPPVSAPAQPVPAAAHPHPVSAVRAATGSDTIQTILIVLLVLLVLFWLGVGFLQLAYSVDPYNFDLLCFGGWNIIFSIINGLLIAPVAGRKKSARQQLYLLAILGSLSGMFQLLFSSAYLQACALPLYILLGILAYINREAFVN